MRLDDKGNPRLVQTAIWEKTLYLVSIGLYSGEYLCLDDGILPSGIRIDDNILYSFVDEFVDKHLKKQARYHAASIAWRDGLEAYTERKITGTKH